MRKSVFTLTVLLITSIVLFAGCKNFLNGNELKKEIEQQIKIANAEEVKVRVNVINNACGSIAEEGFNTVKLDVPFNIDFTPNDEYQFMKWGAFYKNPSDYSDNTFDINYIDNKSYPINEILLDDYYYNKTYEYKYEKWLLPESIIKFTDKTKINTTATVKDTSKEIIIIPLCARRPYVIFFSNENESTSYNPKGNFTLVFNDKINSCILDQKHLYGSSNIGSLNTTGYTPINNKYIKIYSKPVKNSPESERIEITHFFYGMQSEETLKICPYTSFNAASGGDMYFIDDSMQFTEAPHVNEKFIYLLDSDIDSIIKGYLTRFIEIEISKDLYLINNETVSSAKNIIFSFIQSSITDNEPPIFQDAIYYIPESKDLIYEGPSNFNKEKDYHRRYKIADVANGTDTSYTISKVAEKCRDIGDYSSRRIKNSFYFYSKLLDSTSSNIPAISDSNVKNLWYGVRRVSDNEGNKNSKWEDVLRIYYRSNNNGISSIEQSLDVLDGQTYHCNKSDFGKINKSGDTGILLKMDLSSFPDGLYCFEATGLDIFGNYGDPYVYASSPYPDKCTTGYYNSKSYPDRLDWAKHNSQFWFVKDTKAPEVQASQFTFKNPAKLYSKNPEFTDFGDFGFNSDGVRAYDSSRKIKDSGVEEFNSLRTYRICKVFNSDSEANNWKPGIDDPAWRITYGEDYIFDEVYGDRSWKPEVLGATPAIYAYVKDDVGNVSSLIKIECFDNTAPSMTSKKLSDGGGTGVQLLSVKEEHSGIKKIHYDIKSENGTKYDIIKLFIYSNFKKADGTTFTQAYYKPEDNIYTVDSENNVLIFNNEIFPTVFDATSKLDIYVSETTSYNFDNSPTTYKIWLEDGAGNISLYTKNTLK